MNSCPQNFSPQMLPTKWCVTITDDQLLELIKTLCGDPLYLNKEDVGKIFTQVPEVVCQLDDMVSTLWSGRVRVCSSAFSLNTYSCSLVQTCSYCLEVSRTTVKPRLSGRASCLFVGTKVNMVKGVSIKSRVLSNHWLILTTQHAFDGYTL